MQRSRFILAAAAALLVFTFAATAHAESSARPVRRYDSDGGRSVGLHGATLLRVHGGLSFPTGDFGDAFDMGFGLGANIAHGVSRNVLLSGGVAYHHFDGNGFGGDASIVPITFNIEYLFPGSEKMHPYIGGGIGMYDVTVDTGTIVVPGFGAISASESETNFGINFGAGLAWRGHGNGVWGVGFRYHHIDGDNFPDADFGTIQVGYGFFL